MKEAQRISYEFLLDKAIALYFYRIGQAQQSLLKKEPVSVAMGILVSANNELSNVLTQIRPGEERSFVTVDKNQTLESVLEDMLNDTMIAFNTLKNDSDYGVISAANTLEKRRAKSELFFDHFVKTPSKFGR